MADSNKGKKYKVKPTELQRKAFTNIERGMKLRDAMLQAGYTEETASRPKQNLTDKPGFKAMIQEYQGLLMKAGITPEVLAEVQAEGLFDQSPKVRLAYLQETKKDLGINADDFSEEVSFKWRKRG